METTETKPSTGLQLMRRAESIIEHLWGSEGELLGVINDEIEDFFNDSDHKIDQYRYVREMLLAKAERAKANRRNSASWKSSRMKSELLPDVLR